MSNEFGPLYHGADKGVDVLRVFPLAFTVACCLVLVAPFVKCLDLAFDSNVSYWMGNAPAILVFFPVVLIMVAHFIHWRSQSPNKYAFTLGTIGSALVFLVLSEQIISNASRYGFRFISMDCSSSFEAKWSLEQEAQAARNFFQHCEPQAALEPGLASAGRAHNPTIAECQGYEEQIRRRPAWRYLRSLEQQYNCAGWCSSEVPLWALSIAPRDPCSRVVGQLMRTSIMPLAMQVFVYSILVIVLATAGLLVLGPKLRLSSYT
jgi:hypothetical protein